MITSRPDTLEVQGLSAQAQALPAKADSVRHKTFSVWRIAQSMPGATPQQLDSVIQARLPERERHLSTRPDTLCIPGLKVPSARPELSDLPVAYQMSFFENNTLLHPEIVIRPDGYTATPLPYRLWRDNWVTAIILVCFFIITLIIHFNRDHFKSQLRSLFYDRHRQNDTRAVQTSIEENSSLLLTIMLCLISGLGFFEYIQSQRGVFLGQLSPYLLIALYTACWAAYFLIKNITYYFVNWIFFDAESRLLWKDSASFLISLETILLFVIFVISVYFSFSINAAFWAVLSLIIIIKLLLLYKTFQIFFGEKYGSLHLFVYFCTLEIAPLLVVVKILMLITDNLIVKF